MTNIEQNKDKKDVVHKRKEFRFNKPDYLLLKNKLVTQFKRLTKKINRYLKNKILMTILVMAVGGSIFYIPFTFYMDSKQKSEETARVSTNIEQISILLNNTKQEEDLNLLLQQYLSELNRTEASKKDLNRMLINYNIAKIYEKKAEINELPSNYTTAISILYQLKKIEPSNELLKAMILGEIAIIHNKLARLKEPILHYQQAIKILKQAISYDQIKENIPNYRYLLHELGIACSGCSRINHNKEMCLEGISYIMKALKCIKIDDIPKDPQAPWMMNNLGNGYYILSEIEEPLQYLNRANIWYTLANKLVSLESNPELFALIAQNVGNVKSRLLEFKYDTKVAQEAIEAYDNALLVFTFKDHPFKYSEVMFNKSTVYIQILQEEKSIDIRKQYCIEAEKLLLHAKEIYKPSENPLGYAHVCYNLGIVYDHLSNIERNYIKYSDNAIHNYTDCLLILSKNKYERLHSKVRHNIAAAYYIRCRKSSNLEYCEKAIKEFQKALSMKTPNTLSYANSLLSLYKVQDYISEKNKDYSRIE